MAYLANVHRFRSLAIILIVMTHVLYTLNWAPLDPRFALINSLANESSIWFFYIAGFLFQHLSHRFNYKAYLSKKARYVLLPYLVVSIPALIGSLTIYDQGMVAGFDQQPLLMKIWLFLATGKHLAPLWFVPTITLIFLVAPLLLWVDTRRWPYLSLLLLIPLSAWLGRDGLLVQLGLNGNWSPVAKAAYLLSAYIFGMGCSRYYAQAIAFVAHWKWPLLGAVLALFALTALNTGAIHKSGLFSYKILAAPLLLYALSRPQAAWIDRLSLLGHASFGIFFVHCYFLVAIKMGLGLIGLPPLLPGSVVSVLAMTTLVLALSLLALQAAQTLLGRSCRYLVGCNMPRTAPRDSVLTPTEVIVALR